MPCGLTKVEARVMDSERMGTLTENELPFDPRRRLCPDGNCIGTVGPDGRCTECGSEAEPSPEVLPESATADAPNSTAAVPEDDDMPSEGAVSDFASRKLCPDGTCIGVLDSDGRCSICGKQE